MMYGLAWRACYGIWYGLAGLAWYIVWLLASHGIMVWPGELSIGYGLALRVSPSKVWPGGHRMVYGMAWRVPRGIWLWPDRQGMGLGIV